MYMYTHIHTYIHPQGKTRGVGNDSRTTKKVASVRVFLPEFPDTRHVVEWVEFTTFQGKKEGRLASDEDFPAKGRRAAADKAKVVEEKKPEEGSAAEDMLFFPPALRMMYTVLGPRDAQVFKESVRLQDEYLGKVQMERRREYVKMLDPRYKERKLAMMADEAIHLAAENGACVYVCVCVCVCIYIYMHSYMREMWQ